MPLRRRSNLGRQTRNGSRIQRHRTQDVVQFPQRAVNINLLNAAFNYDSSYDYKSHSLVQIGYMDDQCTVHIAKHISSKLKRLAYAVLMAK